MAAPVERMLSESMPEFLKTPLRLVTADAWQRQKHSKMLRGWAAFNRFAGKPGQILAVPDKKIGFPSAIYAGIADISDPWAIAPAATALPEGIYEIEAAQPLTSEQGYNAAVAWALSQYRYKIKNGALDSDPGQTPMLVIPPSAAARLHEITAEIRATWMVRDIINTPANIMTTDRLSTEVVKLAKEFNAHASIVRGKALERDFPLVHAVGKGSDQKPNLTYFTWSGSGANKNAPSILLVGKGVVFDTGGNQIKPGDGMQLMKKDKGGAAIALGLARMIMENDLPVRLSVMIPIAENSVSGNAFRPTDVITAADGTEVEIGHTDAEGRLIVADALWTGIARYNPDYFLDLTTLTGAQRIADGYEVGGIFTPDKTKGRLIEDISEQWGDPLQFHHLFENYRGLLKGKQGGDINSSPRDQPGATIAAMFLQHFTRAAKPGAQWLHFDVNGWNVSARPGRPVGGEAMGMRAAYRYLKAELGL